MQYGQNISIPYSQPQSDLNFLNAAAAGVDHKGKIHPKIERDREEGKQQAAGIFLHNFIQILIHYFSLTSFV